LFTKDCISCLERTCRAPSMTACCSFSGNRANRSMAVLFCASAMPSPRGSDCSSIFHHLGITLRVRGCFYVKKILTVFLPEQRRDFVLSDIKQIKCLGGKLYLAAVLNCYNGEIVGLAMEDNKKGCASG